MHDNRHLTLSIYAYIFCLVMNKEGKEDFIIDRSILWPISWTMTGVVYIRHHPGCTIMELNSSGHESQVPVHIRQMGMVGGIGALTHLGRVAYERWWNRQSLAQIVLGFVRYRIAWLVVNWKSDNNSLCNWNIRAFSATKTHLNFHLQNSTHFALVSVYQKRPRIRQN